MGWLSDLRQDYDRGQLDESGLPEEPWLQFRQWLDEALREAVPEPTAMTLATVSAEGQPSTRVVLLKDADAEGLVWYTNYESRKGQELAENPRAALQFHWVTMERVVRIEGRVEKVDSELSDAYFASRPLESRLGAWASPQSRVITGRSVLVAAAAKAAAVHGLSPSRPPHWGGYRLRPHAWEFWAGRKSRLHDRIRYRKVESGWVQERLAP